MDATHDTQNASEERLELLRRIARLARLEVPDEEEQALAASFGTVLESFQGLQAVEVGDASPLAVLGGERPCPLREDEPRPSLPREELLARAPESAQGHFRVPRTVGGAEPTEGAG